MSDQLPKLNKKPLKTPEQKKASPSPKDNLTRKQNRKGDNPVRIPQATEQCADVVKCSNSWICKNSACRATISTDDTFCKRCSCCICHLFDDNKDPSLWLECTSDYGQGDSCGLTCHIECALQRGKVGVVDLGQLMHLDGSYCCASCGKVSGILGSWKKQLTIAKDARRLDVLCYRIYLSYRLLHGTSRFKQLHEIVEDAKAKLETEVGPVDGVSSKMARGIVSRLPIASDVQSLCSLAIGKADEWLATKASQAPKFSEVSFPAACKFLFEEVTSSSVVIVLLEVSSVVASEDIKGYKLWYCKAREDTYTKDPVSVFPRSQRRILISNLQPCTEYSFRIVSYTEVSELGHSEAKCFTKSVEIIHRNSNVVAGDNNRKVNQDCEGGGSGSKEDHEAIEPDSGFKVRDLGKILRLAWAQQQGCLEGLCGGAEIEKCCEACSSIAKPEAAAVQEERKPSASRQLDLNVSSIVPDLNEELTPSSRDEDNGCQTVEADDDAASHDHATNGLARSHGSGDSLTEGSRKRAASTNGETHDSDSTLINGSPIRMSKGSGGLDENFEYCVKIIRWLECRGLIEKEFRLKLLTWFSLRSTVQERRVVNTFIQTLIDDPSSLAGQLVDTFSEIICNKRQRNGFCCKLWH